MLVKDYKSVFKNFYQIILTAEIHHEEQFGRSLNLITFTV